ncbi:MAG: hypothetical protein ABJG88_09010 [Litorimonas sp.]
MTPEALQRDWLSLHYWLMRCVLPSALILLVILAALRMITDTDHALDHKAVIAGFFTLYFILVRGGHILMTRSLHKELQRKYDMDYREKLAKYHPDTMRRRNIGFTLARIKRELIDDKRAKLNQFKR